MDVHVLAGDVNSLEVLHSGGVVAPDSDLGVLGGLDVSGISGSNISGLGGLKSLLGSDSAGSLDSLSLE